jgi:hypothetical protein
MKAAGLHARARHGLVAVDRAVNRQFQGPSEGQSLNLMADHGCQPTGLGIRQAFTSYSNPRAMPTPSASCAP